MTGRIGIETESAFGTPEPRVILNDKSLRTVVSSLQASANLAVRVVCVTHGMHVEKKVDVIKNGATRSASYPCPGCVDALRHSMTNEGPRFSPPKGNRRYITLTAEVELIRGVDVARSVMSEEVFAKHFPSEVPR